MFLLVFLCYIITRASSEVTSRTPGTCRGTAFETFGQKTRPWGCVLTSAVIAKHVGNYRACARSQISQATFIRLVRYID